jgi:riboflavin biosynthesis pyrimidine reductase
VRRLLPEPAADTSVAEALDGYDPVSMATAARPHVFMNFAVTVDGHATIEGRAGPIGSRTDLEMLMGLRACSDAVLIGAGTIRVERYGRLLPDPQVRARRERRGLPHDPLAVVVTRSMDLPWDAGLFSSGAGRVLVFTSSDAEAPETATPLRVVRRPGGVELADVLAHLRAERGIRGLLCEGGPDLFGNLLEEGLVDELFVTFGDKLAGGIGPRMVEGFGSGPVGLELRWLLQQDSELFARYAVG